LGHIFDKRKVCINVLYYNGDELTNILANKSFMLNEEILWMFDEYITVSKNML